MTHRQRLQRKRLTKRREHVISTWKMIRKLEEINISPKKALQDYAILRANAAYRNELNRIYTQFYL